MRKYLSLIGILVVSVVSCFGQDFILNNPNNKDYFGVRGSVEVTSPSELKYRNIGMAIFKSGMGAELGFVYNFPVVANFYVEPGVKFYYNTYSAKDEIVSAMPDELGKMSDVSYKKYGIRIPIVAGYHFDFTEDWKVLFFTGLELENALSGNEYIKKDGIKTSENLYKGKDGMVRFDTFWVGGIGVTYQHYYFDIHGAIGLVNMMRNRSYFLRENKLTFTLGYNF